MPWAHYSGNGFTKNRRTLTAFVFSLIAWPRGIKKEAAGLDSWAKEIAPSAELRKSYHHGEINYDEFAAAYRRELDKNSAFTPFIELIRKHLETENVTLLYAGKDPEKSQIPTLRNHINTILRHEGKDVYE